MIAILLSRLSATKSATACSALLVALALPGPALADEVVGIPDTLPVAAVATVGSATGTLSVAGGTITLKANVTKLGNYVDENEHKSGVVDFLLPADVPLDATGNRFALTAWCNPSRNPYWTPALRLLVRDSSGIVWAFNSRLQGLGVVPATDGYEQVETFPYTANELGRVTPWMIDRADGKIDEFHPPTPPLSLAGFRLIAVTPKPSEISIQNLRWIGASRFPSPYWLLTLEPDWNVRWSTAGGNPTQLFMASRFGTGPVVPRAYLRPSDLKLGPGDHRYEWDILKNDGWNVAASGQGTWTVAQDGRGNLEFPMLPPGTYHLRVTVWSGTENTPRQMYACYVVLRSDVAPNDGPAKPGSLTFASSSGTNLFRTGKPALVKIGAPNISALQTIEWTLQASDQAKIDAGVVTGSPTLSLDLGKYKASGPTYWLTVRVLDGGKVIAMARRTFGVLPETSSAPSSPPLVKEKLAANDHRIARTKSDWGEGATPVVSRAGEFLAKFEVWMDDAKQDKYTAVELSAPWSEVEPLPGVFVWGPVDRLVDEAEKRGLKVVFRGALFYTSIPSWIPREFQEDQNGMANGLWSGGSYLVASPASTALREGLRTYTEALAFHYRNRACVTGYTLVNMMSDHGWLDQPYLNQFVDYSPAMSSYYVGYLKKKYGSLSKLAAAYGRRYDRWEAIEPPLPRFEKDDSGRLKPATSPVWHDWMDARTHAMWDNKYAMLSGLRQGDPASQIGFYADDTLPYNLSNYVRYGVFVPQGSIEMMFPPGRYSCPVRYEPIGKIARTAQLTDVGMTNILAQCPGRDSFNNFVFPESRVSTLGPTEAEAETRLVQWFSVIDRLYGAKQIEDANGGANPAYLYSIESLFSINQHAFDGRVEDPIKPYKFQVGAEKLHVDWLNADSLGDTDLAARPYYYVPFCADVLTPKTIDALLARVKAGARLVLEPTSGYWLDGSPASNAIGNRLGILPIVPYDTPSTVPDSVETTVKADALGKANLSFRVRGWNPPVETQPVPWLQNVPPAYLRPYRLSAIPANAALLASYPDNSPAAFTMPYGKGDILVFCGVVDWLSCEGLASAVDAWGRKKPWSGALAGDPTLITSAYINNGATYVVGRRFIGHDDIGKLAGGIRPPNTRVAETRNCVMPANGDGSYQVRDLVNGTDFGVLSGASLRARGVDLSLLPGQGFLLEAQPVIATATGK